MICELFAYKLFVYMSSIYCLGRPLIALRLEPFTLAMYSKLVSLNTDHAYSKTYDVKLASRSVIQRRSVSDARPLMLDEKINTRSLGR